MRTQEENKNERKKLKDWKKPELLNFNKNITNSAGVQGYNESSYTPFGSHAAS
jgi:hypothetical protein